MKPISELIDAYFDGTLAQEDVPQLEQWLREDAEHRQYLLRRAAFQKAIEEDAFRFVLEKRSEDLEADPIYKFDRLLAALDAHSEEARLQHIDPRQAAVDTAAQRRRLDIHQPRRAPRVDQEGRVNLLGVHVGRGVGGLKIRHLMAAAVLMAAFVMGYAWYAGRPDQPEAPEIAESQGERQPAPVDAGPVVWGTVERVIGELQAEGGGVIGAGQPIHAGRWQIRSGHAEVKTRAGAVVMLQAPGEFELTEQGVMRLDVGRLTARVPEEAIGFTVMTPAMRVVDLGTEFGVDVNPGGVTTAAVFEGLIELHATPDLRPDRPETMRLRSGYQSVLKPGDSLTGTTTPMVDAGRTFVRDWWEALYRPETDDHCRVLRSLKTPIIPDGPYVSDTQCFLTLETAGVELPADLPNVVTGTLGTQTLVNELPTGVIQAGTRIDSYLVHFDTLEQREGSTQLMEVATTIRFPRPIVGLIVQTAQLKQTDAIVEGRGYGTGYYQASSGYPQIGLDVTPAEHSDFVVLSEDRRELTLTLRAIAVDQLRVWIDAAPETIPDDPEE